jgi:hypothetical protein
MLHKTNYSEESYTWDKKKKKKKMKKLGKENLPIVKYLSRHGNVVL